MRISPVMRYLQGLKIKFSQLNMEGGVIMAKKVKKTAQKGMTVKQLKKAIREETNKANIRIASYREEDREIKLIDRQIEKLKYYAGIEHGSRGEIGLNLSYKTKAQLQKQYSALKCFNQFDVYTKEGIKNRDERIEKSYKEYLKNHSEIDMSREEYEGMANVFGVLGDKILEVLDSHQVAQIYTDMKEAKKNTKSLAYDLQRIYKKNKGGTIENLITAIRNELLK